MKKGIVITCVVAVMTAIAWSVVNQLLWAKSYSYACWRVTHPTGPNAEAFRTEFGMTQPRHIPVLIDRLDEPDGWWVESMCRAWFPEAQPPKTEKKVFWKQWWEDHQESQLVAQHDPQF